jgi:hypothetical protein
MQKACVRRGLIMLRNPARCGDLATRTSVQLHAIEAK